MDLHAQRLEVWKVAGDLVHWAYELAKKFPTREGRSFSRRLANASTFICMNVAQGSKMGKDEKEYTDLFVLSIKSLIDTITELEANLGKSGLANEERATVQNLMKMVHLRLVKLEETLATSEVAEVSSDKEWLAEMKTEAEKVAKEEGEKLLQ